eukprot:51155_1
MSMLLICVVSLWIMQPNNAIKCIGEDACRDQTLDCNNQPNCNIECNGDGACYGSTITGCPQNGNCTLQCIGYDACSVTEINTIQNVICDGSRSCMRSDITLEHGDLNVITNGGEYALANTLIECSSNGICNITCADSFGCYGITINATSSSELNVHILSESNTMKECEIYCPNDHIYGNTKNCNIFIDGNTEYLDLWGNSRIYAVEGFNDINIHCSDYCIPADSDKLTIYCTEDYSHNCSVGSFDNETINEWGCIYTESICNDYLIPTTYPTKAPTNTTLTPTYPSQSPTNKPSNSPIIPPFSSNNKLFVRKQGCDRGDCSSSDAVYDYNDICSNHYLFHKEPICCSDYQKPENKTFNITSLPSECHKHNITINDNSVFQISFNAYEQYNWSHQHIETACIEISPEIICYNPIVKVEYERIDYRFDPFYVGYQNSSNKISDKDGCQTTIPCGSFAECAVDQNKINKPWYYKVNEAYEQFYFINHKWVGYNLCDSPLRDMAVRFAIDCSDSPRPSTCRSLNYSFHCLNGNINECFQSEYDGNGMIDVGEGYFELYDPIQSKHNQLIIQGNGKSETIINHKIDMNKYNYNIECEWQCFLKFKDFTFTVPNIALFKIFNGGNVEFNNIRFDGYLNGSITFLIQGQNTNITFIQCEFIHYKQSHNLFQINDASNVFFLNSIFYDNTMLEHDLMLVNGGHLRLENVQFISNEGNNEKTNNLLSLVNDNSIIDIENVLFHKNQNLYSLLYQNGFSGLISITNSIFDSNINIYHLIRMQNVESIITILETYIGDNNYCLDIYCVLLLDSNAIVDQYSADFGSASPTTAPTSGPTASPTTAPTTAPTSTPTASPTTSPTIAPTSAPTAPTSAPTTSTPTAITTSPTFNPTTPTSTPTIPTLSPTNPPVRCGATDFVGETDISNPIHYYNITFDTSMYSVEINLCDSQFDTIVYFYDSNMNEINRNDDACRRGQSILIVQNVNPGNYIIGIGGWGGSYGIYKFDILCLKTLSPTFIPTQTPTFSPTTPTSTPSST